MEPVPPRVVWGCPGRSRSIGVCCGALACRLHTRVNALQKKLLELALLWMMLTADGHPVSWSACWPSRRGDAEDVPSVCFRRMKGFMVDSVLRAGLCWISTCRLACARKLPGSGLPCEPCFPVFLSAQHRAWEVHGAVTEVCCKRDGHSGFS